MVQLSCESRACRVSLAARVCWQLQTKLNADELRQFARLLMAWHTNRPFSEFCDKVLELYGPNRKYLLAGTHHSPRPKPQVPSRRYPPQSPARTASTSSQIPHGPQSDLRGLTLLQCSTVVSSSINDRIATQRCLTRTFSRDTQYHERP